MKHVLTLVLSVAAASAQALTPQQMENMGLQSDAVMDAGLCRVALDAKDYPNPTILIVNQNGPRRIATSAYLWIRGANDAKTPDGKWVMSERVRAACLPENGGENGDKCVAARALFSTEAPAVRPPSAAPTSTLRR